MKEKLTQYVDGLFRAAALTVKNAELREEILQNTLEKYDDLLSDGKSEDEAYRLAVDGIGDISQLIEPSYVPPQPPAPVSADQPAAPTTPAAAKPVEVFDDFDEDEDFKARKKVFNSIKGALWLLIVAGYILWSFASNAWHITWIVFLIAPAVMNVLDAIFYWHIPGREKRVTGACTGALWLFVTALYFVMSFATGAWHITWILFLIAAALSELLRACLSLWRANHE